MDTLEIYRGNKMFLSIYLEAFVLIMLCQYNSLLR